MILIYLDKLLVICLSISSKIIIFDLFFLVIEVINSSTNAEIVAEGNLQNRNLILTQTFAALGE